MAMPELRSIVYWSIIKLKLFDNLLTSIRNYEAKLTLFYWNQINHNLILLEHLFDG